MQGQQQGKGGVVQRGRSAWGFMVVLLLLAVLGLGAYLGSQLRGAGGAAVPALPVLGAPETGPITLVSLDNRDLDGSPALALTFSTPLDPRQDYKSFIQVFEMPMRPEDLGQTDADEGGESSATAAAAAAQASSAAADVQVEGGQLVKGAWVVGENPRLLFFPHIKPQTRYVVRVAAGLPSLGGSLLTAEIRSSLVTAAVSPAYYFASRGTVLPARQNGGLPVVTVNVPEVDIQFLRVKSEQLPRFLDLVSGGSKAAQVTEAAGPAADATDAAEPEEPPLYLQADSLRGAVGGWELDQLQRMTESVYNGRFLTEARPNRRSITFIPVEDIAALAEPGIYIAVMSQPGRFLYEYQVSYFYTTNLGLHTRLFEHSADAYVSSLDKGTARPGVDIAWLDGRGTVLAQGRTDADGRAHFAERPRQARIVMARQGQEVALIALREPALDLSEYQVGGLPGQAVSLFAYAGRDLYRPGESLEVAVLARDADGQAIAPQPIQAVLKRPDGKPQFTAMWQPSSEFPGYYQRRLELPPDAPTGFWSLELRADPAAVRPNVVLRLGVEEFLPERMKLDLSSPAARLAPGEKLQLEVQGQYLYGAPAAGNRLLGVVQLARQKNPLAAQLPGFEFGDVGEDPARSRTELPERSLDEAGRASLEVGLETLAGRHSPFLVRTTLSLLEQGGRPVVRSIERSYWPAPALLALRPLFPGAYAREGSLAEFEVLRATPEGKLLAGTHAVRLFREKREYYWRFEDQRGWHSGFTETDELVASTQVVLPAGGRGKLALPVKYGRYRLEIQDPDSGRRLVYRFYAGWNAEDDERQGQRPDRVNLKLDKPAYRAGEVARLSITPPHGGEALVSVEADRTLWVKRLPMPATGSTIEIPVAADWQRHDLYVSVLVLRPGQGAVQATPARALGLAHLPLEREARRLPVQLEAPARIEPETQLRVRVKVPEARGQQALLTLAAVDAGILNITQFASPDPHAHFFGRQRYGADLHDVYGRLIEKLSGQKGKLKFGGDAAPQATRSLPRKVKLVHLFSGPVALDAQGEARVSLPVPDFNGSLRLMAVVAMADRFGQAQAEVTVAAPLVAELALPRFLTLGDQAVLALDLHNLSGQEQALQLGLEAGPGLRLQEPERRLSLKDQEKQTLRFVVEAGSAAGGGGGGSAAVPGLIPLRLTLSGGLKLQREFALQVEPATPPQQVRRLYSLAPGASLNLKAADLGGLPVASVSGHLSVSSTPPVDVRSAVQGLWAYPYGCTEQTTSAAYPYLFVDAAGAETYGLAQGSQALTRAERAARIDKALARLGAMQAPNGGFSLWGQVSGQEYWLSAYVSQFLLDSHEQGFAVPEALQQKAMDFLLRGLQQGVATLPSRLPPSAAAVDAVTDAAAAPLWQDSPARMESQGRFAGLAYGSYVLARQARAPLSTLRQLFDLRAQAPSSLALVHLGLALKLMGDAGRGQTALEEALRQTRPAAGFWGDYGSTLRDAALSYALLAEHGPGLQLQLPGQENLLAILRQELAQTPHTSTQEKLALFLVGRQLAAGSGQPWQLRFQTGTGIAAASAVLQGGPQQFKNLSAAELGAGLQLVNPGAAMLYIELALSGQPQRPPAAKQDVLALHREILDSQGKPLGGRSLKVGETVLVRLKVQPQTGLGPVLLVDRIPAGLEIENLNLGQGEGLGLASATPADPEGSDAAAIDPVEAMQDSRIEHIEFRDDRFVAALRPDGPMTLYYRARAVTPGRFVMPPLYAEDMYRPGLYGLLPGGAATLTVEDVK